LADEVVEKQAKLMLQAAFKNTTKASVAKQPTPASSPAPPPAKTEDHPQEEALMMCLKKVTGHLEITEAALGIVIGSKPGLVFPDWLSTIHGCTFL
jgi:hypothetical protein